MKKSKIAALVAACGISVACGITGTLAWFTANEEVTNTFTVGNITMQLDEAKIDESGKPTGDRYIAGEENLGQKGYKIIPGAVIDKDPTVTILAGSEPCYVYVKVENGLNGAVPGAVSLDIPDTWVLVDGTTDIYRYEGIVKAKDEAVKLPAVFTKVSVNGDVVTSDNINALKDETIKVRAFVHQAEVTNDTDFTTSQVDEKAKAYFN